MPIGASGIGVMIASGRVKLQSWPTISSYPSVLERFVPPGTSEQLEGRKGSEVPQVSWTPASVSFCCLISKSTGDSMPLFVCLRFGLSASPAQSKGQSIYKFRGTSTSRYDNRLCL